MNYKFMLLKVKPLFFIFDEVWIRDKYGKMYLTEIDGIYLDKFLNWSYTVKNYDGMIAEKNIFKQDNE